MSSNLDNQQLVKQISHAYPDQITPCYGTSASLPRPVSGGRHSATLTQSLLLTPAGIHPWYTHPLSLSDPPQPKLSHYSSLLCSTPSTATLDLTPLLPHLPNPLPLTSFLVSLRANLLAQPDAFLGEVGLDKAFRIPVPLPDDEEDQEGGEGGGKAVKLTSPLRTSVLATPVEHQVACLKAQILVAVELRRNVSFHSVRAPEDTVRFLDMMRQEVGDDFERIHICLHSFGGSADTAQRIQRGQSNALLLAAAPSN